MKTDSRLKLAVQKSGRLNKGSISILEKAGIKFEISGNKLTGQCDNFPLDIILVRDDDIPSYVNTNACDIGIVGFNELEEQILSKDIDKNIDIAMRLGFGKCRLSLAVPNNFEYNGISSLTDKKIATSYPNSLKKFFDSLGQKSKVVKISGSVEIAPSMNVADAVCDLVSTGATLKANSLKEVDTILESEAVLIGSRSLSAEKIEIFRKLQERLKGVIKASKSKYIMMNAPKDAVEDIKKIIPGLEHPTVTPLLGTPDKIAIHVVTPEFIFWETMEKLKELGASSILVVPIEKILA